MNNEENNNMNIFNQQMNNDIDTPVTPVYTEEPPVVPVYEEMPTNSVETVAPAFDSVTPVMPEAPVFADVMPEQPVTPQFEDITPVMPEAPTFSDDLMAPMTPEVEAPTVKEEETIQPVEQKVETQADNITFDYNQLYGNTANAGDIQTTNLNETEAVVFEDNVEHIANEDINGPIENNEIIPEFNANVLEFDANTNNEPVRTVSTINTVASNSQIEKEKEKNNLIFLILLFAVLIGAVVFLFPMIIGKF